VQRSTSANSAGMQSVSTSPSVVIVGAGPTGLAAGNLLGMAGIDTLILERNADVSDCPKAISIDDEGLRVCQAMGLRDEVLEHVLLDIDAHYLSAGRFLAKVSPTSRKNGYPLISTFHQPAFETTLLRGLDRFSCVETRFQHTVETLKQDDEGVHLTVSTPDGTQLHITCDYLLACDGGKSPIRHTLGISMRSPRFLGRQNKRGQNNTDGGQQWLVVDCVNDDDSSTAATFFCNYGRPAVTVPAPHHARRWEFLLLPGERGEDLLQADKIQELIQQARASHPNFSMAIREDRPQLVRQTIYAFRSVLATRFAQGRVFLLGDAAHLMPPFGGQGMNSGLRDAHNLCWKLQRVLQGQASPGLLETYQEERSPHVEQMILLSSLLGNIIMPTSRSAAKLRDLVFSSLNILPAFRELLTEMKVKPQPRYRRGFLRRNASKESKRLTGRMLPQPYVLTSRGKRILLDEVLGDGFSLMRLYEEPEVAFAPIQGEVWQRLGVRCICVQPASLPMKEFSKSNYVVVQDVEQQIGHLLGSNQDIFALVRPDRYIMGVFRVDEVQAERQGHPQGECPSHTR